MKILFIVMALAFSSISQGNVEFKNYKTEFLVSWNYTTGYHSDGTSSSIRYTTDVYGYIVDIQIKYQEYWYIAYVKQDDNGRNYVKNPNNKRYYF